MPRPKKEGAPEPKTRSRTGCWPCKSRKVKCGEEKPRCLNCERQGETCDYSIRLNWGGRSKKGDGFVIETPSGSQSPNLPDLVFPSPETFTGRPSQSPTSATFMRHSPAPTTPTQPSAPNRARSTSGLSLPPMEAAVIDPDLAGLVRSPNFSRPGSEFRPDEGVIPPILRNVTSAPADTNTSPQRPMPEGPYSRPSSNYPSPSMSNLDSPGFGGTLVLNQDSHQIMPPPFRTMTSLPSPRNHAFTDEPATITDHRNKRMKLGSEGSPMAASPLHYDSPLDTPAPSLSISDIRSPNLAVINPYSPFTNAPITPGSSIASDEQTARSVTRSTPVAPQPPSDLRRLSVSSLLQESGVDSTYTYKPAAIAVEEEGEAKPLRREYPIKSSVERTITYGFDLGKEDLDTPKNDDANAIMIFSPPASRENTMNGERRQSTSDGDFAEQFGFGSRSRDMAFEPGGYYAKPVPIKIPQALEPLPPTLLENRMNLLYFHHFLNHTARILVPHDCEQNPFRIILPEMAVDDEDLLNLMLAYSASHRARLLCHPEPSNRIAMYVKDVFPKLRQALENSEPISIKNLATAIMLASLEILAPSAFGVHIPWRDHLLIARRMIVARGGPQSVLKQDKVSYFLSRWFAYLDVLGSLSGRKNDAPLSFSYWAASSPADDDDGNNNNGGGEPDAPDELQIDCLMGFTSRCVRLLARVAELAKQCEPERLDAAGAVREDWRPPPDVVAAADLLRRDLLEGRELVYRACPHRPGPGSSDSSSSTAVAEAGWDSLEIIATNDMFHTAGLIHLLRRVLNRPAADAEVQAAVREIVDGLHKIRHGSTAEACLLFPMFAAGCEARDQRARDKILSRLKSVESFGMSQVRKARALMQRVWDTGRPWESLVSDEFFG